MDITWHGLSCFTIKTKQGVAVINPYDASTGLKLPKLKADVVIVTQDKPEYNNTKGVEEDPKVLNWAGEYEIKEMAITAFDVPAHAEGKEKNPKALAFTLDLDGLKICYIGDLDGDLSEGVLESIGDVDILMLPVGGGKYMDAKKAHLVVEELEPRCVVPMMYATSGVKLEIDGVEAFMKAAGATGVAAKDKFSIDSRSQLSEEKTEYVLLNPQL